MYSRFKINKSVFDNFTFSPFDKTKGEQLKRSYIENIKYDLKIKLIGENIIDGTETQKEWFPNINADIFLSHSHKDLEKANKFAGWIKNNFNLDVFIDSNLWGDSNKLLKEIDNEICYQKKSNTYDYEKRNFTTSHVHMMLSNSLAEMIDKTECIMFLETPNSVSVHNTIKHTESPWIYNELFLSSIIRIDEKLIRRKTKTFSTTLRKAMNLDEDARFKYKLDLSHLIDLEDRDLIDWKNNYDTVKTNENIHPLDLLYNKKIYL
ncbi:hypothetical protein [Flavobacterium sp.]|jgi:hypothetical protein|uniref:hypothetical protein n=1 Tax=Flavobacterium sp. TaxID=239 RepID=UPI0022BE593F|nr:hypothetical protein [Flavobacterium sp.]MCZ8145307.1 hypothetical protein [Flavobacterium sp.]MCZ8368157.1 hypothetical protein [Flavobacterium sp.]